MIDSAVAVAEELVTGWVPHFAKADDQLTWLAVEKEHQVWLDERTLLMGRMDANGLTGEDYFFGEWKSQAPPPAYKKAEWKQTFRLNPQTLSYGLLADDLYPGTRKFTVRKAFKSSPPAFDHEWFRYTDQEMAWWRSRLVEIGNEIRDLQASGAKPWKPNLGRCFKWGPRYKCAFFECACSKQNWDGKPVEWVHHNSDMRDKVRKQYSDPNLVILSPSGLESWECPEKFRREYIEQIADAPGEALAIGGAMHDLLGAYYSQRIRKEEQHG